MTRPRVLVIDDDPHVAGAVERMLSDCETRVAHSIAEARTATNFGPDVVVLDLHLQDGTARDLVDTFTCPVLLVSADIDAKRLEQLGFLVDDFLQKPFNRTTLRGKVLRLFEQQQLESEVTRSHDELRRIHTALVDRVEAQDAEALAARNLLDRMLQRSKFDPDHVRVELLMARQFGGDVVLADELPDGRYRWLVGDVTGHTLASALVTIPISMVFHTTCGRGVPLDEAAETLHEQLTAILPPSMFFAASVCELDRRQGLLTVYNAGSPDVVVRRNDGSIRRIPAHAPPIAAPRGKGPGPEPMKLEVSPGDAIYAFSDGLLEIYDGATMFGIERAIATIAGAPEGTGFDRLKQAWRAHLAGGVRGDDLALVEVRV